MTQDAAYSMTRCTNCERLRAELHNLRMAVRCYRTAHYECWENEDDYYDKMITLVDENRTEAAEEGKR